MIDLSVSLLGVLVALPAALDDRGARARRCAARLRAAARLGDRGSGHEPMSDATAAASPRYGRYAGLFVLLIVVLLILNTVLSKPAGAAGIPPGQRLPPFAVPLALGSLKGDANVATHANEGRRATCPHAACAGAMLNICELYEHGPVVLALFVDEAPARRCSATCRRSRRSFPGVRFAAVAIKGDRGELLRLVRSRA